MQGADATMPVVRTSMRNKETLKILVVRSFGWGQYRQRLRSKLHLLLKQFFSNELYGCMPGDGFKFSFTFFAGTPQRGRESIGRMNPLRRGMRLCAQRSTILRRFIHPGHSYKPAVFTERVNTAAASGTAGATHAAYRGGDCFSPGSSDFKRLLKLHKITDVFLIDTPCGVSCFAKVL